MADVLTGFTWDRSASRYRSSATGRYVARSEIVNLLGTHISGGESRIESLTRAMYEGTIAPSVYAEQMRTQLRRLHLQNAALGAGGWDRLRPADYGRIGQRLREDYGRINRLSTDVQSGNATIAQALNRANGYVGNSRIAFWETERAAQSTPEPGKVIIERRVLGAHKSCRDCLNYYAAGWQPIGVLPLPALSCACGTNCKCRMERRQVPADEAGQYVKRSLSDAIAAEAAKRAAALDAAATKKATKAKPASKEKIAKVAKQKETKVEKVEQKPTEAPSVDKASAEYAVSQLQQVEQRFADRIRIAEDARLRYERSSADLAALTRRQDEILVESANATPERRKELSAESKQINKSIKDIRKLRDTYVSDIAPAYAERAAAGRKAVYVTDPASNQLNITDRLGNVTPEARQRAIDGLNEFNKLVSQKVMDRNRISYSMLKAGQRPRYDDFFNEIYLGQTDDIATVIHELAHSIEYKSPGIIEKTKAFFERRTQGEQWQSLRELTGKQFYGEDEEARPDRFIDPYIGKNNTSKSTEILSMGLQYMYQDPIRFAREDPDMFDFIYNLVRGR